MNEKLKKEIKIVFRCLFFLDHSKNISRISFKRMQV